MPKVNDVLVAAMKVSVGLVVTIVAALGVFQRKLIWPRPSVTMDPTTYGAELIVLNGKKRSSSRIGVAYFAPRDNIAPVYVYFHGNGDQIGAGGAFIGRKLSRAYGAGFAAVEYPGYPLSQPGRISEASAYEAAEVALEYLTGNDGLKLARSRIVLFGQSIGTGVAMEMATRGWGSKVILLSPFLSLPDVVGEILPDVLSWMRFLLLDRFMNKDKLEKVTVPICIVHGTSDEMIPHRHGEELSRLASNAVFHPLENTGHNDIWAGERTLEAMRIIARFTG